MNRPLLASLALSLLMPVAAYAGTCAAPTPIVQIENGNLSGSTCDAGGEPSVPLGGAGTPHPAQIYSFRYNNSAAGQLTVVGAEREVNIAANCTSTPIGGFAPGVNVDIGSLGLQNGETYIMVVSSDSGLTTTNPPRCGAYTFNWVQLPVSLQNFSVD